jgi:signal transduction histidine kinase
VFFDVWMEASASSLALILFGVVDSLFLGHLRLRHLLWRLQTTQDQLVRTEKEAVFGVMSARVRHELRNVLNLIRAPAEMIRKNFQKQDPLGLREHPEEIISEMDAIIGWVTKLDEMLENELSFFQKARLNLQRQDMEPIIRSAREMMQPLIDERRIQVQLDSPEKTPALPLDADKMRFVFANLIKNACQAMSPGGKLEIRVEPHSHYPPLAKGGASPEGITVIVRDTGTGIPADQLNRIFEPFYTTKPRGLGLGLVNVKNIVEGHGGNIRVESKVGIGTTFFIELPLL